MTDDIMDSMDKFMQRYPAAGPLIGDLYAKALDWPDADRIAERLKKAVPPNVLGEEDQDQSPEAQQQRAMQMQQAQQQQQMAQNGANMELQEQEAKTRQAQANADKAQAEAAKAKFELAQITGQVRTALTGAFEQGRASAIAPMGAPPQI